MTFLGLELPAGQTRGNSVSGANASHKQQISNLQEVGPTPLHHAPMKQIWRYQRVLSYQKARCFSQGRQKMARNYGVWQFQEGEDPANSLKEAVVALNTLQTNFTIINAIRKSGKPMNNQAIPEMIEWCRKAGYEVRTISAQSHLCSRLTAF